MFKFFHIYLTLPIFIFTFLSCYFTLKPKEDFLSSNRCPIIETVKQISHSIEQKMGRSSSLLQYGGRGKVYKCP